MKEQFFAKAMENLIKGNPARMEAELKKRWDAHIEAQIENQRPQMLTEVVLQVAKNQQLLYDKHIASLKQSFDNTPVNELDGLVRRTAAKLGLAVVPQDEAGKPKLTPTILVPDSQDTHMRNTPLSPQRMVDAVDKLVTDKQNAGSNTASSMHNPANVMTDDSTAETPPPPQTAPTAPTPLLPNLPPTPENALLQALLAGVNKVNDRMDNFEHRLLATEGQQVKDLCHPIPTQTQHPKTQIPKTTKQPATPSNCALLVPKPRLATKPKDAPRPQAPTTTPPDTIIPDTATGGPPPIPPRPDPMPGEAMQKTKVNTPSPPASTAHMSLVGKTRSFATAAQ